MSYARTSIQMYIGIYVNIGTHHVLINRHNNASHSWRNPENGYKQSEM